MPEAANQFETSIVEILRPDGNIAVLEGPGGPSLPHVQLPRYCRTAAALTTELRRVYGMETVYLTTLPGSASVRLPLHVAELREHDALPVDWHWIETAKLQEAAAIGFPVSAILEGYCAVTTATGEDRYARLGWFDDLIEWASSLAASYSRKLTGDFSQWNGGRAFLCRFEAESGAVWFKAPGTVSPLEWVATPRLAEAASAWLPEILGTHQEWRGWLAEEVGESLYASTDLRYFELAARSLGQMQRRFEDHTDWLFGLGVQDQTLPFLQAHLPEFMELVCALGEFGSEQRPVTLSGEQVVLLRDCLYSAIDTLRGLGFPDSILHGDIGPGSIVSDGVRCAFIDWSRIYAGFPPLCCELMLNKFAPQLKNVGGWRERLWNAYLNQWPEFRARLAPPETRLSLSLVALMAYVLTKVDLHNFRERRTRGAASYLCVIVRRMFATAAEIRETHAEVCHHA